MARRTHKRRQHTIQQTENRAMAELIVLLGGAVLEAREVLMLASAALRTLDQHETADLLTNKALQLAALVPAEAGEGPVLPPSPVSVLTVREPEEPRIALAGSMLDNDPRLVGYRAGR